MKKFKKITASGLGSVYNIESKITFLLVASFFINKIKIIQISAIDNKIMPDSSAVNVKINVINMLKFEK